MKKKLILATFLSVFSITASAQYLDYNNDYSSKSYGGYMPSEKKYDYGSLTDNYGRLDFMPIFSQPSLSGYGLHASSSDDMLYGIGIGYLFGINITRHTVPLFLELGPQMNYICRYDDTNAILDESVFTQMINIGTPLNLAYNIRLGDSASLSPFVGLFAKMNLLAASYCDGESYSYFDDEAKRAQLGWNAGLGFYINRFYIGYKYYSDITPFVEEAGLKMTFDNQYIGIGLVF